jgi:RNA polymerase sigma-70 factor (sigma-E family)
MAGDYEDFEEFFLARARTLRRTAYVIVRDWHAADDIAQTVMVNLYRRWRQLRWDSVDGYARRAVVNASISHIRKRRREDVVADPPEHGSDDTWSPRSGLLAELAGLTPSQRAVVALRFLDDLPVAEVARVLDVTEGTVKSQTSKALTHLRRQMATQSPESDQ